HRLRGTPGNPRRRFRDRPCHERFSSHRLDRFVALPQQVDTWMFVLATLMVALISGWVVSMLLRVSHPDGLTRVAADQGFDSQQKSGATAELTVCRLRRRGHRQRARLSGGVAGATGVLLVLALMGGIAFVVTTPLWSPGRDAIRRRAFERTTEARAWGPVTGARLHYHGRSVVHRLPAECKIVALFAFVLCVVATPRTAYWAYGLDLLALIGCIAASGVPVGYLAKRMVVELPFVVFAVLLPFIARGERTVVWGVEVSAGGLEAGLSPCSPRRLSGWSPGVVARRYDGAT
ncbi:MAG: hypothetical protein WKF82_06515, partial [Nocardioidaceae bacterium]